MVYCHPWTTGFDGWICTYYLGKNTFLYIEITLNFNKMSKSIFLTEVRSFKDVLKVLKIFRNFPKKPTWTFFNSPVQILTFYGPFHTFKVHFRTVSFAKSIWPNFYVNLLVEIFKNSYYSFLWVSWESRVPLFGFSDPYVPLDGILEPYTSAL